MYYSPESFGNAPYVTEGAERLRERGDRVIVVTTHPHYPWWEIEGGAPLASREMIAGVEIRRRRHYVPRRQTALRRLGYELSFLLAGLTAIGVRERPDAVIGISPAIAGAALARAAAVLYRRPYGLVFQDLMGRAATQSEVPGAASTAAVVQRVEVSLARGASRIAVVSEGFRRYFLDNGIKPEVLVDLPNWTRRLAEPSESIAQTRARLGWGQSFVCVHSGNMGFKQGLDNVLAAAEGLAHEDVLVILAGDGNERGRLEELARDRGLTNVSFLPVQPTGEYEALLQAADILLVNQRPSVTDMSLPSRLTSYFPAGRPIVAAVADESETRRELVRSRGAVIVPPGRPDKLAAAILMLRDDPLVGQRLGARSVEYAATELSRERSLTRFERFVEGVVCTQQKP